MRPADSRARVTLEPRRMWRLRASFGATRWVLCAVALAGVLATARNAIAPPHDTLVVTPAPHTADARSQWFALSFARAYLAWSPDRAVRQAALSAFLGPSLDPDAGVTFAGGSQQPRWLAVAGELDRPGGERDYTVAAGIGADTVVYLAVAVARGSHGAEVLARYPALVGAPVPERASRLDGAGVAAITNPLAVAVLDRALRNYVDASEENLAADLAPHAIVVPIAPGLSLRRVLRLAAQGPESVLATVAVADARGNVFTLAYELKVALLGGRWEITQIRS